MHNLLDLLLLALATWRLTSLLVQETGPRNVFQWMRKHIPHGGLLECVWCCSVWCAALLVIMYGYVQWPVWILAVSAGAILYDKHAST